MEKVKLLKMSNLALFPQYFLCNLYFKILQFQLSSAASLNLGQSQNGVLGNGLKIRNARQKFMVDLHGVYEPGKGI